ncbi:polysaccharide biosynthesis protein [Candidatus Atribacteria bacterium HGW-Atribacteria-1]|nr:MAG: polysaccharide biosynthesis protein [Candidatus Atribacteria bacterium HGW-Atribacteria-1]
MFHRKERFIFNSFNLSYIFKHKLFKNTFIYTGTNVINKTIPFFLLPIMTRYLSPTDYGIVATFDVLLAVVAVFVGLSMHGAINVNYFKLKKEELREYIGNVFIILFTNFILIFIIVFFLKTYLSNVIKFPENWIPIVTIIALCQSIFAVNLGLWQVEQKSFPYGVFQISRTILNVALSLIFVVALVWGWQGRLLGIIITSIVYGIISIFVIIKRKYITFSFNKKYIKDALFFGVPLIPHALGGWTMTSIDRIFINSMVGVDATGIYTVGYQVGMIIGLLANSFNLAWSPFLYEKLKENNYSTKERIVKFTYLYNVCIILAALTLSFTAPYFFKIFVSKNFYFAYKYVLWVALGYAFQGMYFMVVNYIFYVKKTYLLAWVTFTSAGVNIVLNYFFIKANGAIGAAQATTITFFVQFIMVWILSAKVYEMPWRNVIFSKK